MHSLYRFFRSVTLAVVLILFLAVTSILATLVPQGRDLAYYYHNFAPAVTQLILNTGFDNFFSSAAFLFPSVLFFLSLAVCTADRLVGRLARGARLRFGPDLIHAGLLILIVGGVITATSRTEGSVYMAEGDEIHLTEDIVLALQEYRFEQYEDGRPRDWISTVDVRRDGEPVLESFRIEVNRPLRYAGLRVFQTNYAREGRAEMTAADGNTYTIRAGQAFRQGETMMIFAGVEEASGEAVFEEWRGHQTVARHRVPPSGTIGSYTVAQVMTVDVTGLKVVRDPGYYPVAAAFVLITLGLALTYIQKIGDNKL